MDIKKYISSYIPYNIKLCKNKSMNEEDVLKAFKNFYNNDYIALPLRTNVDNKLHINFKVIAPIVEEFFKDSAVGRIKDEDIDKKIKSLKQHEIFNTLLIENIASSRKAINNIVSGKQTDGYLIEKNLNLAYDFIMRNPKIDHDNIKTLYAMLTTDVIMGNNKLDGEYYRRDAVMIRKNKGFDANNVYDSIGDLIKYINDNNDDNFVVKVNIIHLYFELIHPYYDFNGRMGRLLVLWYLIKISKLKYMLYYATTIAAYREQYLAIFNKINYIHPIDATYFVAKMIEMLTKQNIQYVKLLEIQEWLYNNHKKKLTGLEKDIIMYDLAQKDIYHKSVSSYVSIGETVSRYHDYAKSSVYTAIDNLAKYHVLVKTEGKEKSYKILYERIIEPK